jgi:hypothetical protein
MALLYKDKTMNAPYKPETVQLPDITLSGEAVGHIINALNNSIVFAKTQDGSMRPFIDPAPIKSIIEAALNAALPQENTS